MFKSFGASFVPKYNYRHNRTGPLFNGRYYSSAVNDDEYLFMVTRYIHNNPVKARICQLPDEYQWSSYNDYYSNANDKIAYTDFIESIISKEEFLELHKQSSENDINDFVIKSLCDGVSDLELVEFFDRAVASKDIISVVDALKKGNISKRKMERLLKVPKKYIQ